MTTNSLTKNQAFSIGKLLNSNLCLAIQMSQTSLPLNSNGPNLGLPGTGHVSQHFFATWMFPTDQGLHI